MIFLILLITFFITELLVYHLGHVAIVVPVVFIIMAIYYLYCKNHLLSRGELATYEKKIEKLKLIQRLLLSVIFLMSLAVMINFITRVFLFT